MSCSRKRTHSFSNCSVNAGMNANAANKKKRKVIYKRGTFVPPTKFLLGGNIRDPLNLSGLQEEDESKSEDGGNDDVALPSPDEFLLGGNISDPLNLQGIVELESCENSNDVLPAEDIVKELPPVVEAQPAEEAEVKPENCVNGVRLQGLNLHVDIRGRKLDRKDKIVSPVIPQPYRPLKTVPFRQIITPDLGTKAQKTPKFKEKNTRFQYGNCNRYYGYRNTNNGVDLRLEIFEKHRELFEDKDVLDIGCNVGHVSLIVARSFNARSVTGIDIDRYLVDMAKRNVQYYVNCPSPYTMESPSTEYTPRRLDLKYKCYPVSMPILYGPIYDSDLSDTRRAFPKNVRFVQSNYVLESETLLETEQPQFDTILCLSVTKWIHLNWGDDGLKIAFKRMFAQLKPGGILVLEPQSWDSYKKKKSLTETIWRNYQSIQLFPHHFDRYLLSSEVGFSRCQTLAVVNHHFKGFRRAIKVFRKPTVSVQSGTSKTK